MRFSANIAAGLALLAALCGCDRRASKSTSPTRPAATLPATIPNAGTITGQILFAGPAPNLPPLNISSVPDCAKHHPGGLPDESVVINPNGTLKNVVVYLKGGPKTGRSANPQAVLDQVNCQYVPHVVAL